MNVDAQTKSSYPDLIGGGNVVTLDRVTVDQGALDWVIVLHRAGLTVKAQGCVARREGRIVQTDHDAGIAAYGHLSRGEHQRSAEASLVEDDDF